jgi:hypothetical protein
VPRIGRNIVEECGVDRSKHESPRLAVAKPMFHPVVCRFTERENFFARHCRQMLDPTNDSADASLKEESNLGTRKPLETGVSCGDVCPPGEEADWETI